MNSETLSNLSPVETRALELSSLDLMYAPEEKIPVITVGNFPALGKLVALRFIEWAQANPGGVVSLPTGKTPEHFIKWVEHILETWDTAETRNLLEESWIDPGKKPDISSLHFIQIDEFYPIKSTQTNSFYHYIKEYYFSGFGLDPNKALLMNCQEIGLLPGQTLDSVWPGGTVDLSLRTRQAGCELERVQQDVLMRIDDWCLKREEEIRALGGIGFFLGGIGPDGHVGFNIRGSDHLSITRLIATNYETQAAAAGDLGGIEVSRNRLVITIGLGTITYNPDCTAIIIAAGESKARVIADAVEGEKSVRIPAAALRSLQGARFYITLGAAKKLGRRQVHLLEQEETISDEQVDRSIIDLSLRLKKPILQLTDDDARQDSMLTSILSRRGEALTMLARKTHDTLVERIEYGRHVYSQKRFLHTEPHHDDLMLGCLPAIVRNIRDAGNDHHFVTLTSGFTAVTNQFMLAKLDELERWIDSPEFVELDQEGYFDPENQQARNRDIWQYLDGIAGRDEEVRSQGAARRMLRNIREALNESDIPSVKQRMVELRHYFSTVFPGRVDTDDYQTLKGMCREWEAETLWGYFGWQCSHMKHLRLPFYTGDIFVPEPTVDRDVKSVLTLMNNVRPDVISCALDPEASGPDTHYKVLQVVSGAVDRYAKQHNRDDLKIWGYRNVWYRFHPSEANMYVPVSLQMLSMMESSFHNTFISQREASFPSYEHDGPFCELAQDIQVDQYQMLKTCLGRSWFAEHPSAMIRASRGFVFLREMDLTEFSQTARSLRKAAEDVD